MRAMSMCSAPVRQFLVAVPGRGGPEGEMRGESGAAREITLGREGRGRAASYYALPGATHGALRQDMCGAAVRAKRWRRREKIMCVFIA